MTTDNPKPARRIPDEGLFTVHFSALGEDDGSFDAQVSLDTPAELERVFRKVTHIRSYTLSFVQLDTEAPGTILADERKIGRFTITPPTLKGDPDEPT